MSTPAADPVLHPCACGCGEMVKNTYARGHHMRKRRLVPLPGPDVADEDLDMGLLEPDLPGIGDDLHDQRHGDRARDDLPSDLHDEEPIPQDRPPGHLSAPPGGRERGSQRRAGPVRVTAAVRKDITAKIKMPLFVGGKIWEARDPWCGGTFVAQFDPISEAFADIVCDSADLVAWFTGPAGGFMKYLNLATALAPVAQVAWAHHIAHSIGREGQPEQPDMARYAA